MISMGVLVVQFQIRISIICSVQICLSCQIHNQLVKSDTSAANLEFTDAPLSWRFWKPIWYQDKKETWLKNLRWRTSKLIKNKMGQYDINPLEVVSTMETIPYEHLFLTGDVEEYKVGGMTIKPFRIRRKDQEMRPPRSKAWSELKNYLNKKGIGSTFWVSMAKTMWIYSYWVILPLFLNNFCG